ncbi:hypothetical protein J7355_16825 [Endozoicomonas sp. G2_2]|uniref:DNA replication terminus site-binding protein n=1 Tax=Endozoicomonas sp. G2_2 TaxID=2821092 RepID=UPI001ADA2CBC|nr:DNA replication terminus site-binding protein [Endozoicomonas sp. G2_2]MBO9471757.1 hypothetical protein [Endozoicomonas sp. G2_2]
MDDIATIKAEIAQAARALEGWVREFNDALALYAADWPAVCYAIERFNPDMPQQALTVTRSVGEPARLNARAIFAAIDYAPEQSPNTVRRMAGVVCAPREVLPALDGLNAAKEALKTSVGKLPRGRWQRERASMSRAATLSLLQAYRRVRVLPDGASRVSFTWDRHGASGRRLTVAQARELVQAPGYHGPISQARQNIERAALVDLPETEVLLQRKPIAPTPAANVWLTPDARPIAFRVDMPVVVITDAPEQAPKIYDLEDFDPQTPARKTRSDRRVEDQPLIERLHLYRYTAAWRGSNSRN